VAVRRLELVRRGLPLPLALMWVASGVALAAITTRVRDWFAMPNEMLNEHRAISVAQTLSPLPTLHGQFVASFDQLYPILIAPAFAFGSVLTDVQLAHGANAFLMTSACIPVYLLARRVTSSPWLSYLIAFLSICMPWIFYASLLMNEVVAYPMFAWTLLAFQRALVAPSRRRDAVALAAILLAFLARTQLALLAAVLPAAVLIYELARNDAGNVLLAIGHAVRSAVTRHPLLARSYAGLVVAAIVLAAAGSLGHAVGVYGQTVTGNLVPHGIPKSIVWHLATFSLGVGILPFVVGVAWLLANLVRPPEDPERRAFACLGTTATVTLLLEVTVFDLRFVSGEVLDRYLIYLVPVVLVGFACALGDARRPRLALLVPAAALLIGFVVGPIPATPDATINSDEPIRSFYPSLVASSTSVTNARVLLVGATVLSTVFFVGAQRFLSRRVFAVLLSALSLVAFPYLTSQLFIDFLSPNGTSDRPLTSSAGAAFSVIDQLVGTGANVAIVPYPVSDAYFVNQRVWRDYEFWNKSVDREVMFQPSNTFTFTNQTFPKLDASFDPTTGASSVSPSPWVIQADQDTRARIAGPIVAQTEVMLIRADQPWHAAWISFGLYDDGWTKPGVTTRVRVFAVRGVRRAVRLSLTFGFRGPDNNTTWPVTITSSLDHWRGEATYLTQHVTVDVCVPPGGYADAELRARGHSSIPGDLDTLAASEGSRIGGIFIGQISVSDNIGLPCRPARNT